MLTPMRPSISKLRLWIGAVVAAVLLLTGSRFLRSRLSETPQPIDPAGVARPGLALAAPPPLRPAATGVTTPASTKVSRTTVRRETAVRDGNEMRRIPAGAVLATVNGTPLTLKDLLPLPADPQNAEHALSAERYAFLLERAVDRELVFQQARAQGLELSKGQREQLARLRARSERAPTAVFDDLEHNPANAEFEARDATAWLLQATLAEAAGVPSREVTPAQVEQYYREHPTEFAVLPSDPARRQTAWETINQEIRVKLAGETFRRHEEGFAKFVEQTRAAAQIVRTDLAL